MSLLVRGTTNVQLSGDISFGGDACLHMSAIFSYAVRQFFPLQEYSHHYQHARGRTIIKYRPTRCYINA